MSAARPGEAGATRACPHCKATILESSAVCPACRGHLKFGSGGGLTGAASGERIVPLSVEGTVRAPEAGAYEYTVVVVVRNDRGEEVSRHVAGVGAMFDGEERSFSVAVEAVPAHPGKRRRH